MPDGKPVPWRAMLLVLGCGLVWSAPAQAIVGDRFGDFGLDGSLRTITGASVNYDSWLRDPRSGETVPLFAEDADGFSQSILRLEAGGEPLDWLKYEFHGVQDLNLTTSGDLLGGRLFTGSTTGRYRFADGDWRWGDADHVRARMWIDRLNLRFRLPWFDIKVGRQPITFGKAHFWNPLDVFLAFDPRQFDRDYKPGVDALRIDVPIGMFSGVTAVGVAGRDPQDGAVGAGWRGSALLLRAYTTQWEWDFSVQGGKVYGGYQVGAAAVGEVLQVELRAEGAYFFSMDEDPVPDHFTGVLGLGHRFDFDLLVEAEYLYNGAGDTGDWAAALQRVADGRSYHMGRHLLGVLVDYQILPILRGSLAWIFSFSDRSSLLQPSFVLSVADEADFLFGAMIALGARPTLEAQALANPLGMNSEFGTYPNFYYMEFKFYF
jgi:hypothetical protein